MDHAEGFDWWYRSGVTCACDHKVLFGYHSKPALETVDKVPSCLGPVKVLSLQSSICCPEESHHPSLLWGLLLHPCYINNKYLHFIIRFYG